jgi:hypothetical protein
MGDQQQRQRSCKFDDYRIVARDIRNNRNACTISAPRQYQISPSGHEECSVYVRTHVQSS